MTCWHITISTFGSRLCGTKTLHQAQRTRRVPQAFREIRRASMLERMKRPPVTFVREQMTTLEAAIPVICLRGGWHLRVCAAQSTHVHLLLDADPMIGGAAIRRLLKRWLTQHLNERWRASAIGSDGGWWAEGGSARPVANPTHQQRVFEYILRQRATQS